jgi:hypothetical protein
MADNTTNSRQHQRRSSLSDVYQIKKQKQRESARNTESVKSCSQQHAAYPSAAANTEYAMDAEFYSF